MSNVLEDSLVIGISKYQTELAILYSEYYEFLRSKGYRCIEVNKEVYRIHPDYYSQWLETKNFQGFPTGAVIEDH